MDQRTHEGLVDKDAAREARHRRDELLEENVGNEAKDTDDHYTKRSTQYATLETKAGTAHS